MNNNEHAVIGALVREPTLINEIELTPDDFAIESYRIVYQLIIDSLAANQVIDIHTLYAKLGKSYPNENWMLLLSTAAKDCISEKNVSTYARLVKNESRNRQIKSICNNAVLEVDTADSSETVLDVAIQSLMALTTTRQNHEKSISQSLKLAIEMIDDANENDGPVGITTGIDNLDSVLGGFHDSDLYIIGARPAIGKTSVLLNFINSQTSQIGLISTEQPAEQIASRLISINGRVNASRMRNGNLQDYDWTKLTASVSTLHENNNIWINDKSGTTILDLIRQARKWKHQHDIKALYVDYVQRIKWTDLRIAKWEQVGNVVASLKELARDLQIPVISLAQVNREVDKRTDKRPCMGDLANSSEIEKEADVIMTLYRDEVYNDDSNQTGIMEIDVCKNRHGPTGTTRVTWQEECMRIDNLCQTDYAQDYN